MTRVLIVDDDPQLVRALRINLGARHYEVLTAPDATTGLAVASQSRPDLVIVDLGLPDLDGVAVVEGLRGRRVSTAAGGQVRLTPTEWHLLEVLARHPGRLVTHQQLLQEVWGPQYTTETNYLRVHIANLRRKLEPDPARPRYLRTDPGIGYRFVTGADPDPAPGPDAEAG